jgi:radical SAM protein (TIGR01212 family)
LDQKQSIREQVISTFSKIKVQRANSFILYFQNYSNTYASVQELKQKYDDAISAFYEAKINSTKFADKKLVGLQIATRPDCINDEIAELLNSYRGSLHVSVELGLQTINDDSANFLNRCYTSIDFQNAIRTLRKHDIDCIAHIIVGLPAKSGRESHEDIIRTINFINGLDIQGIKIHSCYVVGGTVLKDLYDKGTYTPLSLEEYKQELVYILTHLRKDIVIHRITGDAPKDILVAPSWNSHKKLVINGITKIFEKEDLYQGMYYKS